MRAFTSFVLAALVAAPAFAAPLAPIETDFPTPRIGTPVQARQGGPVQNLQSSTDASTSAPAPATTASANAFNIRPGFGPGPVILPREPLRPVSFIPVSALQGAQGKRQLDRTSFIKPFDGPIGQGPVVPNSKRQLHLAPGPVLANPIRPVALNQRQEAAAGAEFTDASGATATDASTATATDASGATATEAVTATEAAGAASATATKAAAPTGTEAAGATATAVAGGAEATSTATGAESAGGAEASGAATAPEAGATGAAATASGEAPAASGAAPTAGGEGAGGRPGRPYGGKGPFRMYGFMKDGSVVPMGDAPASA